MFFGKIFGKKEKEEIPSDFVIPRSRNLVLIGCSVPKRRTLLQAFCDGEKEAEEEKHFSRLDARVKFKRREFEVSSDKTVILNIWGITGKENFRRVVHPYCRGAHGIALFYDITSKHSFTGMKTTIEENSEMISELNVPVWVVEVSENKKEKSDVKHKEAKVLAKKIGAKLLSCYLEETERINEFFRYAAIEVAKKYNTDLRAGLKTTDMPSKPVSLPQQSSSS